MSEKALGLDGIERIARQFIRKKKWKEPVIETVSPCTSDRKTYEIKGRARIRELEDQSTGRFDAFLSGPQRCHFTIQVSVERGEVTGFHIEPGSGEVRVAH
jgi:hypothetical protein